MVSSISIKYEWSLNRSTRSIGGTLTVATTLSQSGPESNDNDEVPVV